MSLVSERSKEQFISHPDVIAQAVILLICMTVLYWPVIPSLVKSWDLGTFPGFIVPLASIYILWRKRAHLREARRTPVISGLFVMLAGGVWLFLGIVSTTLFISHISLVITLIGLVLYILGWEYFRVSVFPLLFLFLMIPLPPMLLGAVTDRLQTNSAYFGVLILQIFNVPVVLEGKLIHLLKTTMLVAEACAGFRYIFSTAIIGVVLAYATQRTWLPKFVYMVIAVLIAITANILRVASAGMMAHFIGTKMIKGIYHSIHGYTMFLFDYGMLIVAAILLSRLFRRAVDHGEQHEV